MELGKKQKLTVARKADFGIYLKGNDEAEEAVLLPKAQVPEGTEIGDELEVFLYKDSRDRLIATTREPKITLGQVTRLNVAQVTNIGAFLDWGLEKDLLLPFKEQTVRVQEGESHLVALYIDKSSRLCATMKIYNYLETHAPYKKEDRVEGTIYEISDNFGVFVAVDDKYQGLIPKKDAAGKYRAGEKVQARVTAVKPDGKLDLTTREKAYLQMESDAEAVLAVIDEFDGVLPFTDKASSEVIRRDTNLSKNAFKRAVGRLLKEGKIEITEKSIRKL